MWTPEEIDYEFEVAYTTRLGMMCGDSIPTKAQEAIAREEAFQTIEAIKQSEADDVPPPP